MGKGAATLAGLREIGLVVVVALIGLALAFAVILVPWSSAIQPKPSTQIADVTSPEDSWLSHRHRHAEIASRSRM